MGDGIGTNRDASLQITGALRQILTSRVELNTDIKAWVEQLPTISDDLVTYVEDIADLDLEWRQGEETLFDQLAGHLAMTRTGTLIEELVDFVVSVPDQPVSSWVLHGLANNPELPKELAQSLFDKYIELCSSAYKGGNLQPDEFELVAEKWTPKDFVILAAYGKVLVSSYQAGVLKRLDTVIEVGFAPEPHQSKSQFGVGLRELLEAAPSGGTRGPEATFTIDASALFAGAFGEAMSSQALSGRRSPFRSI